MTVRNWAWNGKFRWFVLVITLVFVGILVLVNTDETTSRAERISANLLLGVVLVMLVVLHNWITISPGTVRIGYVPFYRRTLPLSKIRSVSIVEIKPVQQYGGWGIKGLAKSRNGLLLGGYPPRGLRFETVDDRRYVVTFPDLDPIVAALANQGCTLSADNEAPISGKV